MKEFGWSFNGVKSKNLEELTFFFFCFLLNKLHSVSCWSIDAKYIWFCQNKNVYVLPHPKSFVEILICKVMVLRHD